jgi:hypothetical protein
MAVASLGITEFTSSAVAVYALQKLKSAKWFPLAQEGKAWLNRYASIALAALGAVGVNYTWTTYNGSQGFFIAWPGWFAIGVAGWHWLNHYVMQETIYQATVNKVSLTTQPQGPVSAMKVTAAGEVVVPKTA